MNIQNISYVILTERWGFLKLSRALSFCGNRFPFRFYPVNAKFHMSFWYLWTSWTGGVSNRGTTDRRWASKKLPPAFQCTEAPLDRACPLTHFIHKMLDRTQENVLSLFTQAYVFVKHFFATGVHTIKNIDTRVMVNTRQESESVLPIINHMHLVIGCTISSPIHPLNSL